MDRTTLWRWRDDERWRYARKAAKELWKEHAEDLADAKILEHMQAGDPVMARFVKKGLSQDFGQSGGGGQAQAVKVVVNQPGPEREGGSGREIEVQTG